MFGFIERRVLKEHMKLVAQNYSALSYLSAFLPPHVGQRYSEIIACSRQLGARHQAERSAIHGTVGNQQAAPQSYDASPARSFGMKHFDKQFQPILGWNEYYSQYL